jgi:hypothetical protein
VQVFEGWSHFVSLGVTKHPGSRQLALNLLQSIFSGLVSHGRRLVLAVSPLVPAPGRPLQLTAQDVQDFLPFVDALAGVFADVCTASPKGVQRNALLGHVVWPPPPAKVALLTDATSCLAAIACSRAAHSALSSALNPRAHLTTPSSRPAAAACAVMTYDFSGFSKAGPNAPLDWVQQNADAFAAAAGRLAPLLGLSA